MEESKSECQPNGEKLNYAMLGVGVTTTVLNIVYPIVLKLAIFRGFNPNERKEKTQASEKSTPVSILA